MAPRCDWVARACLRGEKLTIFAPERVRQAWLMRLAARLCLLNATSRMMQADGFEGEMSPEVHGPACPSPLLSPVSAPNPSRPSASEPGVHAMQAALAAVWRAVESDAAAKPDETPLPIYPSPATPWQDRARRALQPLADRFNAWFAALDIAQDLSEDIGSPRWRRWRWAPCVRARS